MKEKRLNIKTAKKLIFICFSMFLFSFALVPLYNVICDVTGLNGNTSNLKEKVEFYTESESLEKLNNIEKKEVYSNMIFENFLISGQFVGLTDFNLSTISSS